MYRTEQKYFGSYFDNISKIEILGVSKQHPSRKINSIYFDTNDLSFFRLSEEGSTPRQKIRLRWYKDFDKLKIECKYKELEFSRKLIFDIGEFNKVKIEQNIKKFTNLKIFPKLQVSYLRKYFIDKKSQTRYTLDYNITFYKIDNNFKSIGFSKSKFSIIEVKKNINNNEYLSASILGSNRSRFSKYCEGIKEFY